MEDLDLILLEQYHACKRRLKAINRLRLLYGNDPGLDLLELSCKRNIQFFEMFISDRDLLKIKVKRTKVPFCLKRNPIYQVYRNGYIMSMISYRIFLDSLQNYFSFFKKS